MKQPYLFLGSLLFGGELRLLGRSDDLWSFFGLWRCLLWLWFGSLGSRILCGLGGRSTIGCLGGTSQLNIDSGLRLLN